MGQFEDLLFNQLAAERGDSLLEWQDPEKYPWEQFLTDLKLLARAVSNQSAVTPSRGLVDRIKSRRLGRINIYNAQSADGGYRDAIRAYIREATREEREQLELETAGSLTTYSSTLSQRHPTSGRIPNTRVTTLWLNDCASGWRPERGHRRPCLGSCSRWTLSWEKDERSCASSLATGKIEAAPAPASALLRSGVGKAQWEPERGRRQVRRHRRPPNRPRRALRHGPERGAPTSSIRRRSWRAIVGAAGQSPTRQTSARIRWTLISTRT